MTIGISALPTNLYYKVSAVDTRTIDTMSLTAYYGAASVYQDTGTQVLSPTAVSWYMMKHEAAAGVIGSKDSSFAGSFFGMYTSSEYGIAYNTGGKYYITAYPQFLYDLRAVRLLSSSDMGYFITAQQDNIFNITAQPGAPDFSVIGLWGRDVRDYTYLDAAGGANFPYISTTRESQDAVGAPGGEFKPYDLILLEERTQNSALTEFTVDLTANYMLFGLSTKNLSAADFTSFDHLTSQFDNRNQFSTYAVPDQITTTAVLSSTSMTARVCSDPLGNSQVYWRALRKSADQESYISITSNTPSGSYDNCSDTFAWAGALTGCTGTDTITVLAKNDTDSIFLTVLDATSLSAATATSGIQSFGGTVSEETGYIYIDHNVNLVEFRPRRVDISTVEYAADYAILSASYIDSNGDRFGMGAELSNLIWDINSTDGLSGGHGFDGNNRQTAVETITLSAGNPLVKNLTACINDEHFDFRTLAEHDITLRDNVTMSSVNLGSAIRIVPIYSTSQLTLNSLSPTRSVHLSTNTPNGTWVESGDTASEITTAASHLTPYITLSANSLSATYSIAVCSVDSQDDISWRPYLNIGSSTTLALCTLSSSTDAESILYTVKTYGKTDFTAPSLVTHNLPLDTEVTYTHTLLSSFSAIRTGIGIQESILLGSDFEWDVDIPVAAYAAGSYDTIYDTVTANTNPSGSTTFETLPTVGSTYFNPLLQITNEGNVNSPAAVVYMIRPSTSAITLDIEDSSILTGDLTVDLPVVGYASFTAPGLTGVPVLRTIAGATSAEVQTDFRSKTVTVTIPPSVQSTSIVLDVTAFYGSTPATSGIPVIKNYTTCAIFVSCDTTPTSTDITIIPEYKWNDSTRQWDHGINTSTFEILDTPVSAIYGYGRIETLVLSAVSSICIGKWDWDIRRSAGLVDSTSIPPEFRTTYNFKTCATTSEYIDLILTPYTAIGDLALPTVTAASALYIQYEAPNAINTNVDFTTAFAAPGTLSGIISATNIPGDMPIDYQITTLATDVSTMHWTATARSGATGGVDLTKVEIDFTVSDIGEDLLSIPKFRTTEVSLSALPYYRYSYVTHPRHNDWNYPASFTSDTTGNTQTVISTGYPVVPHYYLKNKYVELSGGTVSVEFDNETVWPTPFISAFEWTTNSVISTLTDNAILTGGPYTEDGTYSIKLVSELNGGDTQIVSDTNGLVVLSGYPEYNATITRRTDNYVKPTLAPCGIGSNDWVTSETVNNSLKKIYDNIESLLIASKIYDEPPYEYIGWLGSVNLYNTTIPQFRWFVNIPSLQYNFNNPSPISDVFTNIKDVIVKDNELWVSNKDSVFLLSNDFIPTKITEEDTVGVGVTFNCIRSIQLDVVDDDRVYLLDSVDPNDSASGSRNKVYVFEFTRGNNNWSLLFNWGGLGAASSKYKFRNPGDILIDSDNFLYVADTDNLVVKKYTRTGTWIKTISNSNFTASNKPVSLCQTPTGDIHILCGDKVIVIDTDGIQQRTYDINTAGTYRKIRSSKNDGFVYAMSDDNVIKCNTDGTLQLALQYYEITPSFTPAHRAIFQDDYRNLYTAQESAILKFNDQIKLLSLIDEDVIENRWTFDEVSIERQEYVQDWVFNKAINRLWDNIEILRKAVLGKLSFKSNLTYVSTTAVSGQGPTSSEDCTFDWLPGNLANLDRTQTYCYVTPIVRGLLPDEYIEPTYVKGEVIIGINELVTADVINRVLCQLQTNIDSIYDMLEQSGDKSTELCDGLSAVTAEIPSTTQDILTSCYPEYSQYF